MLVVREMKWFMMFGNIMQHVLLFEVVCLEYLEDHLHFPKNFH